MDSDYETLIRLTTKYLSILNDESKVSFGNGKESIYFMLMEHIRLMIIKRNTRMRHYDKDNIPSNVYIDTSTDMNGFNHTAPLIIHTLEKLGYDKELELIYNPEGVLIIFHEEFLFDTFHLFTSINENLRGTIFYAISAKTEHTKNPPTIDLKLGTLGGTHNEFKKYLQNTKRNHT